MRCFDTGVKKESKSYFHTPSSIEKLMFLYPLCTGHFYCVDGYKTSRENFHNYLLMYIRKGQGSLWYGGKSFRLSAGDMVFIDCDSRHSYETDSAWETVWVHFNGLGAQQYYEVISEKLGNVIAVGDGLISQLMMRVFNSYDSGKQMNEAVMSSVLQRILAHIYEITAGTKKERGILYDILQYIDTHYREDISVDLLCAQAHLSRFYFCRLFKKELGYSPYEYLTIVRLGKAKQLLRDTDMSVKEIAFDTGFHSEANFIRTFKAYTEMTPGQFRRIKL